MNKTNPDNLENYFSKFRKNIIGNNQPFETPYGKQNVLYADWIASGRLYRPIENQLSETMGPWVANTHTETNVTGTSMTLAYHYAHSKIKQHVNASKEDVIITSGFGMTSVVNKLQRMLGLKTCGMIYHHSCLKECEKPIVFITHMEHHSNQTSWYETIADVEIIAPGKDLSIDLNNLEALLIKYKDRKFKIGAFTACSNVTGIHTPYHAMAKLMHQYNGLCFVDFAASAPYCDINMHPENPFEKLDAIYFSPHKFLGGPGASGVLIFDSNLYKNDIPDNPGGGTVAWTNPWGKHKYVDDIEAREDGGTPGFIQAIKTALCIDLKEKMNTSKIIKRETEIINKLLNELNKIPKLKILANNDIHRLGVVSFYFEHIHYNLVVKLLNDRFGIQVRGGCACAGTYGHYLLNVTYKKSKNITDLINHGDLSQKPGWVRASFHPTTTDKEIDIFVNAVKEIGINAEKWACDYAYIRQKNEFINKYEPDAFETIKKWFSL